MKKTFDFSPNFSKRIRSINSIKFVVIHYTGMQSEIASVKRLKNKKSKVSCHYLINKKGKVEDTYSSFTKPMSNKIINKIESILFSV